MAMTTRPPTRRKKSALTKGFDSLTLDPSPRLRRVREEMSEETSITFSEAWKAVGRALIDAMKTLSRNPGTGR